MLEEREKNSNKNNKNRWKYNRNKNRYHYYRFTGKVGILKRVKLNYIEKDVYWVDCIKLENIYMVRGVYWRKRLSRDFVVWKGLYVYLYCRYMNVWILVKIV